MEIKFCSDAHLYEVVSLDWRKQENLEDYAKSFLHNWNENVKDDDVVCYVGDIGKLCRQTIEVFQQLKGQKILVIGNHDDTDWLTACAQHKLFKQMVPAAKLHNIFVVHDPADIPKYDVNGTEFIVHGHHHQYTTSNMKLPLVAYANDVFRYNCCLDLNRHKPCKLQELMVNKALLLDKLGLS